VRPPNYASILRFCTMKL